MPPGVFRPRSDSRLLAATVARFVTPGGARVLDLGTGSGVVAITAALAGAAVVVAVDVSRRAVVTASVNARLNRTRVEGRHGTLYRPVRGERFGLIASNPPYLPAGDPPGHGSDGPGGGHAPGRGAARAWEGGEDGRFLLDRIIDGAPTHLEPGGILLLAHSSVCGVDTTIARMASAGLDADVLVRERGPLGPLLSARAPALEARGLLRPGEREEDLVIVRGRAP